MLADFNYQCKSESIVLVAIKQILLKCYGIVIRYVRIFSLEERQSNKAKFRISVMTKITYVNDIM